MGSKAAGSGGQSGGMGGGMGGMQGGDVQPFNMPPTANPYGTDTFPFAGGGKGWQPPFPPQQPQQPPNGMPQVRPDGVWGGANGPHHMSDDDYLQMMYQTQLGRQPDQGGMDYWRQQMAGGMGRDQVRQMFDQSEEGRGYDQRMAPMIDDFGRGATGQNQPSQMDPQILDAMRLAWESNRPQRTYTPEEWSATFGPNVTPDPRVIRQEPQYQGAQQNQLPPNVGQALALLSRLFG